MTRGYFLSESDARKTREIWNWFRSSERRRKRQFKGRQIVSSTAEAGELQCRDAWAFWIGGESYPSSGNITFDVTYVVSGASSSSQVTIAYDAVNTVVKSAFEIVTELEDTFSVAGTLPGDATTIRNNAVTGDRITSIRYASDTLNSGAWCKVIPMEFGS